MTSWGEVRRYIDANYPSQAEGDSLTLGIPITDTRSQIVFVYPVADGSDHSQVRFFSPFAATSQVTPQQLASITNASVLGVTSAAGMYGFLHVEFLAELGSTEIDLAIPWLAHYADKVENELGLGDEF